jgi:hypothetical protein
MNSLPSRRRQRVAHWKRRPTFLCPVVAPFSTFSPVRSLPLRTGADIGQPIGLNFGQPRLGRPRRGGGSRSISRPSDRSTEPASGLGSFGSRSLRQEHRRAYGTPASITKQSGLEPPYSVHAAPWQPHQLISGRAPMARTKILHTRGSSAPRWMGLVSRTADKANPASSVTHPSRL